MNTTPHLQPELWAKVNRLLISKAISELAHELLVKPTLLSSDNDWGMYCLQLPDNPVEYRFRAQIMSLFHWRIDRTTIEKYVENKKVPLDALNFIIEFHQMIGIPEHALPVYLDEISSTLFGSAYKHHKKSLTAEELTRADFQSVEIAMMEGHPTFIANNGRIGFNATDYHAYAPEAAAPINLIFLAVHQSQATFASISTLSYQELMQDELGETTLAEFNRQLLQINLNPDEYLIMPCHPWQWHNKIVIHFSADIATQKIIYLGQSNDSYQAQQSIRTLFNLSKPEQRYVKMSLSILNMGFMRGLSPYYMSGTPAINEWLKELISADPFLVRNGFTILQEVASVGYRNSYYETAITKDSPYKKMLSALWRESPLHLIKKGQRLMTMASLLHTDTHGNAVLPALIKSSGLDTSVWIKRYLTAYLTPLLHCFYAHDMVFMPHGENLILILENNVPVRALMKDIAEEVNILNLTAVLPEKVQRIAMSVPDKLKLLSFFTDIFDCIFRYMTPILFEQRGYPENAFWQEVATCVHEYQLGQPEFKHKFEEYDLFVAEFPQSCLNRLQLSNNQHMVDLSDPAKNLKFAGTLKNPIAPFKRALY